MFHLKFTSEGFLLLAFEDAGDSRAFYFCAFPVLLIPILL